MARGLPRDLARNPASWYVAALAVAVPVEGTLSPDRLDRLLAWSSTNLANLHPWPAGHPVEALVASAFVPQDSAWVWPLLALSTYAVVSLLGARRAVAVLALVHVGVTAVTETMVWWRIRHGSLPASDAHLLDTGPSYLVVAAMAVAVCCARAVWTRLLWLVLLGVAAPGLLDGIGDGDCSAVGHVLAFMTGLAVVWSHRRRRTSPVLRTV
ncbi:rhomboid-like protein [Streptomyces sp. NPDC059063]|uniref:rhomboid-like protein n=1 Tax=unclassified Streptomyces TaxID=2593676 RepID=UPI003690CB1A